MVDYRFSYRASSQPLVIYVQPYRCSAEWYLAFCTVRTPFHSTYLARNAIKEIKYQLQTPLSKGIFALQSGWGAVGALSARLQKIRACILLFVFLVVIISSEPLSLLTVLLRKALSFAQRSFIRFVQWIISISSSVSFLFASIARSFLHHSSLFGFVVRIKTFRIVTVSISTPLHHHSTGRWVLTLILEWSSVFGRRCNIRLMIVTVSIGFAKLGFNVHKRGDPVV